MSGSNGEKNEECERNPEPPPLWYDQSGGYSEYAHFQAHGS